MGQDTPNNDCRVGVLGTYYVPGTGLNVLMYILLFNLHHNTVLFCITINLLLLMRKLRFRKVKLLSKMTQLISDWLVLEPVTVCPHGLSS